MKINRKFVLESLKELQRENGGYFGTDLSNLAKELGVTNFGLRKRLSEWLKHEPSFSDLIYLGKYKPSITLDEFLQIETRRSSNPLEVKSHILSDLQMEREAKGEKPLTIPTFYRATKQTDLSRFYLEFHYPWFEAKGITIPPGYYVEDERESLSTIFTYSNLKTYGGTDLQAIYDRLMKAKECFSKYKVDPMKYYPNILKRGSRLRSLLTSIPPSQQEDSQARLIFEIQNAYIIEGSDLFLDELIHRKGRIQQSMNASRQKTENDIREKSLAFIRNGIKDMELTSTLDKNSLHTFAHPEIDEATLGRMMLLRKHTNTYNLIFKLLDEFIKGTSSGVAFHCNMSEKLYQLAKGEISWRTFGECDKKSFLRKSTTATVIDRGNEDVARILAIDRMIEYIRHGKITFSNSYCYQDLGTRIKEVKVRKDEESITPEILEQLISGKFVVDIWPLLDAVSFSADDEKDDKMSSSWIDLSDALREVSRCVRETNPGWFEEHKNLFREQTDGMFSMEYTEEEFAERLYDCIGFLGRNLRYRESDRFQNLRYFIQRYITEATLRLELKFIHRSMERINDKKVLAVVIDTMGIEGRKKSILVSYHGRYHTIGYADLRAVSTDMTPISSISCRSTDSEAMNIVEVMANVRNICGDCVKIYTGNGHTISRISAGMAFLSHGIVAAGRVYHKPRKPLGKTRLKRLRNNIQLQNKVGKLLREEPSLGRVIAKKKHIYVDRINVRRLIEDLGYLILSNVSKYGIPIGDISNVVERSNYLKRRARIIEGSRLRVDKDETGIHLLSSELLLCGAGLYHMLNGWSGHESPINLSDIRLFIPA